MWHDQHDQAGVRRGGGTRAGGGVGAVAEARGGGVRRERARVTGRSSAEERAGARDRAEGESRAPRHGQVRSGGQPPPPPPPEAGNPPHQRLLGPVPMENSGSNGKPTTTNLILPWNLLRRKAATASSGSIRFS